MLLHDCGHCFGSFADTPIEQEPKHLVVQNGTDTTFDWVSTTLSSVYCLKDGRHPPQNYLTLKSQGYIKKTKDLPDQKVFGQELLNPGFTCQFPIPVSCIVNNQSYAGITINTPKIPALFGWPEGYCAIAAQGAILRIVESKDGLFGFLRRVRLQNNLPVPIQARINLLAQKIKGDIYVQQHYLGPMNIEAQQALCFDLFILFALTHSYFYPRTGNDQGNPMLAGIRLWKAEEDHPTNKNSLATIGMVLGNFLPFANDCSQFSFYQKNNETFAFNCSTIKSQKIES